MQTGLCWLRSSPVGRSRGPQSKALLRTSKWVRIPDGYPPPHASPRGVQPENSGCQDGSHGGVPMGTPCLGGLGCQQSDITRRQKTSQTSSCERGLPWMQCGDEHRTENRRWESRLSISSCFSHAAPLAWNLSSVGRVCVHSRTCSCLSSR